MKNTKLLSSLVSLSLVFGMMTGFSAPTSDAKSKKISLSKKTLTIDKGTKKTLKVKNTKKKVSFKITSGKKYISIKKKGNTAIVIKGKKVGKAKVLAKVAGKKLTCNIKVVKKTTNNNSKATNNTKATETPAGSASATTNVSQTPSATATSTASPTATSTNSITPTKDPNKDTEGIKAILEFDETGKIVTGCKNYYEATYAEIPEGVTTIGEEAFSECNTITSIVIPKGVTVIENLAFCYCSLSSIVLPEGITSIGSRAFEECYNLESIKIPNSVTEFGSHIFDYCDESLSIEYKGKTFTVKSFNNEFGQIKADLTFDETGKVVIGCENEEDATYIEIPDGVTGISDEAFYHCYYISNIKIADSVTEFGINIFKAYTDEDEDEETTTIIEYKGKTYTVESFYKEFNIISGTPARLKKIGNYLKCTNYDEATYAIIPSSVIQINDEVFSYAEKLQIVVMPEGLKKIGNNAFYNCISLKNIKIPDSVTEFGTGIFDGCEELTSIEYKGQTYTTVESFYVAVGIKAGPNTLTDSLVEKLGLTSGDVVKELIQGADYTLDERFVEDGIDELFEEAKKL